MSGADWGGGGAGGSCCSRPTSNLRPKNLQFFTFDAHFAQHVHTYKKTYPASLHSGYTFLTTCKLKVKTLIFSTNCTPRPQQFSVTTFISSWHKLLITLGDVPYKLDLKWKSLNTLTYCPFTLPLFGYSWSNFISNNKIVVIWVIIQWWFFYLSCNDNFPLEDLTEWDLRLKQYFSRCPVFLNI